MNNPKIITVCICPMCEMPYALGVNGTVDGCDPCLRVVRNAIDNTIIDEQEADADTLTDMEKAIAS